MKLKKEMKSNSRIVNEDEIIFKDFSVHGEISYFHALVLQRLVGGLNWPLKHDLTSIWIENA